MMEDGHDIVGRCRANMEVIRSHYALRCAEDESRAVLGDPAHVCREIDSVDGVRDVAAAYITPQRGMNPVFVSSVLEWDLRRLGVDVREGSTVHAVTRLADGRYRIDVADGDGKRTELLADQVSLCAATAAFRMARELNPSLTFPRIFLALRTILYVDLPDGTDKDFTCLKLEDAYGGMLSPLNKHCAMIYHPPAAHIANVVMDPSSCAFPTEYARFLAHGHPEAEQRAQWTLQKLREFYPELARSSILGIYLKVAINTVDDSRMRRNIGVFQVQDGCTMTALPKWTMCAVNARKELTLALDHSVATGNLDADEARARLALAVKPRKDPPPVWASSVESIVAHARRHAINMGVPEILARPMSDAAEGVTGEVPSASVARVA